MPLLALLLAVVPLGAYAMVHLPLAAHLGLSLGLMGTGLLLLRRFPKLRIAALLLSAAASARYLYWRGTETLFIELSPDGLLSLALFGAELYGFVILLGGYFQTAIVTDRRPPSLPTNPEDLPSVDIFIPTYNEPIDVLRRTVVGALGIDYANKTVYILDDTPKTNKNPKKAAELEKRRKAVAALAQEVGCIALRRPNNKGAKAGNINHALKHTKGELIAIFDADHVPVRTFLQMTVGFFTDNDNIALVQTPHHFYNPDPFERNLFREGRMPPEQHLFYHRIQKGNDFWNSAFFCGSCAVIRRKALEEVGGIAQETVTEDAHTALKLHGRGWESRFIDIPQAAGLATEKFGFHVQQRIRWARGMAQILRTDNPLVRPGLTLAQRFNYFNAAAHFLFGVPRIIYLLAPSFFLIFGLHPLNADVRQVLIYALPHLFLVFACTASVNKNTRMSFWPEIYETSIAWYTAWVTTVALIAPKIGTFNVTPKGDMVTKTEFDWRSARPMIVLFVITLISMAIVPWRIASEPSHWDTITLAAVWNLYNLVILAASLMVAVERPQRRQHDRIAVGAAVEISEQVVDVQPLRATRTKSVPTPRPAAGRTHAPPPPPPHVRSLEQLPVVVSTVHRQGQQATLVDLSEGGARLMLQTPERLPDRITLRMRDPIDDQVVELSARVRSQREEGSDEQLVAGLEFEQVTPQQRIRIIRIMFSDPDRWTQDRFQEDSPILSALDVVFSPVRVIFNHLTGRNPVNTSSGEALSVLSDTITCRQCGAQQLAVLDKCSRCGADLPLESKPEPAPMTLFDRTRRLVRGTVAVPLVAVAVLIAIGWKPVTNPASTLLDAVQQDRVTPSRVGELASAHRRLTELKEQFEWALLPLAPSLRLDFSKRLWSTRYSGELDRRDDPEYREVVILLDEAATLLEAAGRSYREGSERPTLRSSMADVDERLDHASRLLASALRDQEST
ncbi:MAG: UDP-forming cellulose synthase catalytic subunit [Myxococcota bacterium]